MFCIIPSPSRVLLVCHRAAAASAPARRQHRPCPHYQPPTTCRLPLMSSSEEGANGSTSKTRMLLPAKSPRLQIHRVKPLRASDRPSVPLELCRPPEQPMAFAAGHVGIKLKHVGLTLATTSPACGLSQPAVIETRRSPCPSSFIRGSSSLIRISCDAILRLLFPHPVSDPHLSHVIVTFANEDAGGPGGRWSLRGVLAASARNKRAYAAAHSYGLVTHSRSLRLPSTPAARPAKARSLHCTPHPPPPPLRPPPLALLERRDGSLLVVTCSWI
jgi:hypothetical protein